MTRIVEAYSLVLIVRGKEGVSSWHILFVVFQNFKILVRHIRNLHDTMQSYNSHGQKNTDIPIKVDGSADALVVTTLYAYFNINLGFDLKSCKGV